MRLFRHRSIVIPRKSKTGTTTIVSTSPHENQFSYHSIQRLIVPNRVMQKPTKWPGTIQRCIKKRRILSKQIHPKTDPMRCKLVIIEQCVDKFRTFIRFPTRKKSQRPRLGWWQSRRIQENSTHESCIPDQWHRLFKASRNWRGWPSSTLSNPASQGGYLLFR